VYDFWSRVCGQLGQHLDGETVAHLEGRIPSLSTLDRDYILDLWRTNNLFCHLQGSARDDRMLDAILTTKYRIPSLRLFLEDSKYLEVGAKALKMLLPEKYKGSIQHAFQHDARSSIALEGADPKCPLSYNRQAYLQVWLFAFRNFADLTEYQPRKEPGRSKPVSKGKNFLTLQRFAVLAEQSGIENMKVMSLVKNNAQRDMCSEFLQRIDPNAYLNGGSLEKDTIALMAHLSNRTNINSDPSLQTLPTLAYQNTMNVGFERRCGRPFELSYYIDRQFLYLKYIYDVRLDKPSACISSFAIQREIFRAFFYDRSDACDLGASSTGLTDDTHMPDAVANTINIPNPDNITPDFIDNTNHQSQSSDIHMGNTQTESAVTLQANPENPTIQTSLLHEEEHERPEMQLMTTNGNVAEEDELFDSPISIEDQLRIFSREDRADWRWNYQIPIPMGCNFSALINTFLWLSDIVREEKLFGFQMEPILIFDSNYYHLVTDPQKFLTERKFRHTVDVLKVLTGNHMFRTIGPSSDGKFKVYTFERSGINSVIPPQINKDTSPSADLFGCFLEYDEL
jgi:hypothetical protein